MRQHIILFKKSGTLQVTRDKKDSSVIFWLIQLLFGFGPVEQMRTEKGDSSRTTL